MRHENPDRPELPELSSDEELSRALEEVLRHEERRSQAQREAQRHMQRQQRRGIGPRHGVFALALAVTLYVWIASPAWARVDRPPPPTPEHREASLRVAIFLQAQRIEAFRDRTGGLPEELEETGPPIPGISYARTPRGTYHLEGQNDTLALFYSSSALTTLPEFLGEAERLVVSGSPDSR